MNKVLGWDCPDRGATEDPRRSRDFVAIAAIALLAMTGTGCPDDTCTECWCDPAYCPDGGDADGDADDGTVTTGHLTVTSVPVSAESVEINGAADPRCSTTPCELDLPSGLHRIHLSATGRLHLPDPVEVNLLPEGTEVNIFLGWDLAGRWRREVDGTEWNFIMTTEPPDGYCPETSLRVINVNPIGTLCLETNDTLSLCKNHASECGGDWTEGTISPDGRRMEVTFHYIGGTVEARFAYSRID